MSLTVNEAIEAVIIAGRRAATLGWVPATSGNFSVRCGEQLAITRSGRDKGQLTPDDVALISLAAPAGSELSAETPLHLARYAADPGIGAVFHVHSPAAAVLSRRLEQQGQLILQGWELQKGFAGVTSHLTAVRVPILANDQDLPVLASKAEAALRSEYHGCTAPAYLVAGHGMNAWGRTPSEAQRHLEALDALLVLHMQWMESQR